MNINYIIAGVTIWKSRCYHVRVQREEGERRKDLQLWDPLCILPANQANTPSRRQLAECPDLPCEKDPIAADPFFFPLPLSVLSILISNALFSLKIWQVTAGK
jgi:hypothetical protein